MKKVGGTKDTRRKHKDVNGEKDRIFLRQSIIESQSHEKSTLILQFLPHLGGDKSSWWQEIIEFMESCMNSPNISNHRVMKALWG